MSYSEGMSPADYAAVTKNNDDGFGGSNGAWWLIVLFLFAFTGWGNGGNRGGGFFGGGNSSNGSVADSYVLASDFATLQRQLSDGFNNQERRTDAIINGICDLGYTQQSLANTTNMAVAQGNYNTLNAIQQNGYESRLATQTLGSQLAQCCCDIREGISGVNYNMAMNSNALQNTIQTGFCQTNFNGQTNTRDIIDSQNANTRAILDAIESNKVEALRDRIAEQNQHISALQLAASQERQNAYLIDQLGTKCPIPAYLTCNPNAPLNYSVNYGGCGCNS